MSICGIYLLNFDNNESIYIGQSQDVESRYKRHVREMQQNKHYNYRVQSAYNNFGIPSLLILDQCSPIDLTDREMYWIDEFNSCKQGLNLRDKDESALRGPEANSAKYTREQILKVFELLTTENISRKDIEIATGVPVGNINSIARGASHLWLKEEFPSQYLILENIKYTTIGNSNSHGAHNKKWPDLVSPDGSVYKEITNLKKFCAEHNIPYDQIHRVCAKKANSAHGWKLSP